MSGEEMLHCPYNYSHVILKSRMANHLQKCREQFPLENYTTCPFNATHDVPVPELKYHADTCPDRKTMESYLYVMDDEKKDEESKPMEVQTLDMEENWDEEKISGSYLEIKSKVKIEPKLFMPPVGKSKSEKKAFSQSQVQKFQKSEEKSNVEKTEPGSSQLVTTDVSEKKSESLDAELGMVASYDRGEDFKEMLKKTKKIGLSRGSIIRDTHLN